MNGRITEYSVIIDDELVDLEEQVNSQILEGWQPIGGISTGPTYYTQAMVKYNNVSFSKSIVKSKNVIS